MNSAKEIFAFIAAFVGAITAILALVKTYLEVKKLRAEKSPEKEASPPAKEAPAAGASPPAQTPPAPSPAPHDHDKMVMGIALQVIGIVVIVAGVAWLLHPVIYPPPLDLTKSPRFDPSEKTGFLHWPYPQMAVCVLGNFIWNLGRGK